MLQVNWVTACCRTRPPELKTRLARGNRHLPVHIQTWWQQLSSIQSSLAGWINWMLSGCPVFLPEISCKDCLRIMHFSSTGGSPLNPPIRICLIEINLYPKVFPKPHLNPCCVILHASFKIHLNQRIFTGIVCSDHAGSTCNKCQIGMKRELECWSLPVIG